MAIIYGFLNKLECLKKNPQKFDQLGHSQNNSVQNVFVAKNLFGICGGDFKKVGNVQVGQTP
jgi:hypothetical protein